MDFPASTPPPSTPAPAPRPARVESFKQYDNKRVLARLIDLLIVGIPATYASAVRDEGAYWMFLAFSLIYFFVCEATMAQTIGKRAMGLRVMTRDGRAPSVNAVSVRTVLRLIDDGPLGALVMLVTGPKRQRIGDMLAGTHVGGAGAEVPRPKANVLLALYPTAWLIGAIVFITLPSSASAQDYVQQATAICRSVGDREPSTAEWTGVMQEMYRRHTELRPPKEYVHVHEVLLETDSRLLEVFRTIDAAGGDANQKVVRQMLPVEMQALKTRDAVLGPVLPGCAGSGVK
jgi:uncharacterized RDD family membrane protein YckC